jgi:hypothetical protein
LKFPALLLCSHLDCSVGFIQLHLGLYLNHACPDTCLVRLYWHETWNITDTAPHSANNTLRNAADNTMRNKMEMGVNA